MSDATIADVLPVPANAVRRVELVVSRWGHIVPDGRDWRSCLRREYWTGAQGKFNAGDTVEIQTADHRVWFEMLVLYVNTATDPVSLDVVFRPLYPADLELPAPERQRPARFETRQFPGTDLFTVVDLRSGERQTENPMYLRDASDLAASLQRAADSAEAHTSETVMAVALREATPRTKRGRPRKAAPRAVNLAAADPPHGHPWRPDAPDIAAASSE